MPGGRHRALGEVISILFRSSSGFTYSRSGHRDTPGRNLAEAPWRALCPARVVELRDPDLQALQDLPGGTPVVLLIDTPFSRLRLRRLARRARICIDRELIAVPSTTASLVLVDDAESAVRHFWMAVATVPPGLTWSSAPATLLLLLARMLPWELTGAVAPGRVLIGRRR